MTEQITLAPSPHRGPKRRIFPGSKRKNDATTTGTVVETTRIEQPEAQKTGVASRKEAPKLKRSELVGLSITTFGIVVALFLFYVYLFSALTGARGQNQLLHSLVGDKKAVFSLATNHLPKDGQPVAIMTIPSIGLHQAVVLGTSPADLQKGPGLVSSNGLSGLPGEEGTAIVAGKRVSFGGPFAKLGNLVIGDQIKVVDGGGSFEFTVTGITTVTNGTVTVPEPGTSWLVLVTSNSVWLPSGRLVVTARIDGIPVTRAASPTTSHSLPDLGGDPSAGILAALWALGFLGVLLTMAFAIRRRQVWVTWLLAAPLLLACGLFACESLARCLPSTL
jgi:LPXTG-site transpeptidase (sortase) family protein